MIFVWILCEKVSELMIRLSFVRKYGLNLRQDDRQWYLVHRQGRGEEPREHRAGPWSDRVPGVDGYGRSEGKGKIVRK